MGCVPLRLCIRLPLRQSIRLRVLPMPSSSISGRDGKIEWRAVLDGGAWYHLRFSHSQPSFGGK